MIKIVDIPIYKCSIVFLIGTTKEEWIEWYAEHTKQITEKINNAVLDEYQLGTLGFVLATEGNDYICYTSKPYSISFTSHEIFHAAHSILWDRGYTYDVKAEPMAYLLEYIMNEFYLLLEEQKIE